MDDSESLSVADIESLSKCACSCFRLEAAASTACWLLPERPSEPSSPDVRGACAASKTGTAAEMSAKRMPALEYHGYP